MAAVLPRALQRLQANTMASDRRNETTDEIRARLERATVEARKHIHESDAVRVMMGIPRRYYGCTLVSFVASGDMLDTIDRADDALDAGRSVFITGKVGTGKTHLAVALMYESVARGLQMRQDPYGDVLCHQFNSRPVFYEYLDLLMQIKETFGSNEDTERSFMQSVVKKGTMTVIDDLGVEKATDWTRQSMFYLVDRLYASCKPCIITSNLSIGDIASQVDDRIASRIAQMCYVVKLTGDDHRLNARPL